ncbi:hypothetical protein NVP3058O_102 [Vibrio phage 3.058.O._10N.286.46.B8]|nr:hypothetical protein NVP2058O_103 [Vibrio phage 2.058.O._10N.286.46.B8]AUS03172.1 hypothetical protein NVP3058O_102 [Vibrio phage 3.058.O._10N.286.46.B8]
MRQHASGYEVYKANLAIMNHFKRANFDFFKGGRIKFSEEKYNARPDRVFYDKIAEEYPKGDMLRFLAINQLNGCTHVSQYCGVAFKEWECYIGGLEYHFEKDLKRMVDIAHDANVSFKDLFKSLTGGMPIAMQLSNGNHIKEETICLIDMACDGNIIKQMDNQVTDMFVYPNLRMRIVKYSPWIPHDKREILEILKKYINQ